MRFVKGGERMPPPWYSVKDTMAEPDPTYTTDGDKSDSTLITEVIALRADLIGLIKQAERVLEAEGMQVESVIVTRRERRERQAFHLTRRRRER